MKKAIVSALLAAPTLMAGAAYLTPTHNVQHLDYKLVDEALVIIPVDNQEYADAAADLYLKAAGFRVTARLRKRRHARYAGGCIGRHVE